VPKIFRFFDDFDIGYRASQGRLRGKVFKVQSVGIESDGVAALVTYPYITVPRVLAKFLNSIKDMGVPPKITIETLSTLGYKSTNHRPIPRILEFINFIDSNSVPTQNYIDFRVTDKSKVVMAQALRTSYSELFQLYPDAYNRDNEALRNFFTQRTTAGPQVVARTIDTFRVLCEFADFEAPTVSETPTPAPTVTPAPTPAPVPLIQQPVTREGGVGINVNIRLELPATNDADVYDKIFQSIKKHLLTPSSRTD
jgi:hypothetical protein